MTDDIRGDPATPVDLLIVGGLTIDVLPDAGEVVGGAARYATEAAVAAGLRVALLTVAADEPIIAEALDRLRAVATVIRQAAPTTISFEHHGRDDERRLRLRSTTEPIRISERRMPPPARAVLFAPVAGEVTAEAVDALRLPPRVAGIQGWLRRADADGWVEPIALADMDAALAAAVRGLDLVMASHGDLGTPDGRSGLAALRGWAGPGPRLIVTAGPDGAWLYDGQGEPRHVPAEMVEGRDTIGAGDAFAAIVAARLGMGSSLVDVATAAAEATATYLATRESPGREVPGGAPAPSANPRFGRPPAGRRPSG